MKVILTCSFWLTASAKAFYKIAISFLKPALRSKQCSLVQTYWTFSYLLEVILSELLVAYT